jgi:hypothetical protein
MAQPKIDDPSDQHIVKRIIEHTKKEPKKTHAGVLAKRLGKEGLRMKNGKMFHPCRTIYGWIKAAYGYAKKVLKNQSLADMIADKWVDATGKHAWEQRR